jgi:hypothetical protein
MTLLFDKVLRHRCPNDVQALIPPTYDKFPAFERLDYRREQVRAALWQSAESSLLLLAICALILPVYADLSMKLTQACLKTLRASMRQWLHTLKQYWTDARQSQPREATFPT